MLLDGFHHACVKTRDWDRTMRFYCEVLGCTVKLQWRAAPQRAALLDSGRGNYVEVFEDLQYVGATQGAILHFAFRTSRLDEVLARVRASGAAITMEPKSITLANTTSVGPVPIRVFFCEGPNGESVEFFENTLT
jgi:catechol 2,3-dioxygenase-like lactoylglutathione lyase family enzyme